MDLTPYLGDLGPTALLGITILLILTGRLVTRGALRDKQDEADRWRHAWELSEQARREERRQTEQMLDGLNLITHIVRSIRTAVGSPGTPPGDEDR